MRHLPRTFIALNLITLSTLASAGWACDDPIPFPPVSMTTMPVNNKTSQITLCFPAHLFEIPTMTLCGCGIGFAGQNVPASLNITGASVKDGNGQPLPFTFAPNATTTSTLSTGGSFGTPPVAGATWFGFFGASQPFGPPVEPGMHCFFGTIDTVDLPALQNLSIEWAGGHFTDPNTPLLPDFGYAAAVPEPSGVALLFAGGVTGMVSLRRRRCA